MWSYSDIQWQQGMLIESFYSQDHNDTQIPNSREYFLKKNLWPLQLHLDEELNDLLLGIFYYVKLHNKQNKQASFLISDLLVIG